MREKLLFSLSLYSSPNHEAVYQFNNLKYPGTPEEVFRLDSQSQWDTFNLQNSHPVFLVFVSQTVEKFFSREIKYLVSNKREARYVHCLRQDSPVPSPESGPSSPYPRSQPHRPGSHGDGKSRSQGQTDTVSSLLSSHRFCPEPLLVGIVGHHGLSLFSSWAQVEGSLWWRESWRSRFVNPSLMTLARGCCCPLCFLC